MLLEIESGHLAQQPAAQRPRAIILARYQEHDDLMVPVRDLASLGASRIGPPFTENRGIARTIMAACELIARAKLTHHRPPFGIDTVMVGNREVAVREEAAHVTPFGTLLHFKKDIDMAQPRVLLVAPLSGHFATLLRATVNTMLADHDVYLTDWHNARDVALAEGSFGFDDFIQHLIDFLDTISPGAHVVAVCQPCVAALVATAVMAQSQPVAQPRSITLMPRPIHPHLHPTHVNELATSNPIPWFEQNLIATVPSRDPGAFLAGYPCVWKCRTP